MASHNSGRLTVQDLRSQSIRQTGYGAKMETWGRALWIAIDLRAAIGTYNAPGFFSPLGHSRIYVVISECFGPGLNEHTDRTHWNHSQAFEIDRGHCKGR